MIQNILYSLRTKITHHFHDMVNYKPFVPDNLKKYKIRHTLRINILVVLKYETNKELFKISSIF